MNWWVGAAILVGVARLLRQVLRMNQPSERPNRGLVPLNPERESIYLAASQELETQCTILGISLNDAIDERNSGHPDIAWRLVRLFAGEWERVAEILGGLSAAMGKRMGDARVAVPVRSMMAHRFKSRRMVDYFRMHELLDQLVFRSRLRFQLQVRVLRRAAETLTAEFFRAYRYAELTGDHPDEFWRRLDLLFHDLDLLGKEMLLAFRAFLACLPDSALPRFAADLDPLLRLREPTVPVRAHP